MSSSYPTLFDGFCGAGGSSEGAVNAGFEVKIAVNHSPRAIETHSLNHPRTQHDCADMQAIDPSRYDHTTVAWFSPTCTNHSIAKGRRRKGIAQLDLWGKNEIDPTEERSRATMVEVVEFSAYHRYELVVVENVVDIRNWAYYDEWLMDMINLGYDHKVLYLNAMFFGVPQSRDRIYVVFWKKGNHAPDLDFRPWAYCIDHGVVGAVQNWKRPENIWGRYGVKHGQYVYCCPQCGHVIEPFTRPAADVIDWSIPSPRIGDRKQPLKPKTIQRIKHGLKKFYGESMTVDTAFGDGDGAARHVKSASEPLAAQTARQTQAFILSYMNNLTQARSVEDPLYTIASGFTPPLVTPQAFLTAYYGREDASSRIDDPLPTVPTQNKHFLVRPPAFISSQYGNGGYKNTDQAMPTIVDRNKHMLVSVNYFDDRTIPLTEPMATQTTASKWGLLTPDAASFMVILKNSWSPDGKYTLPPRPMSDPLSTLVAAGSQHALIQTPFIMAYYGNAPTYRAIDEPTPTITTKSRHGLVDPEALWEDCGFRMLTPAELALAMSFPGTYIITGNQREKVSQIGNAVACKVAQAILERCLESLR